MWWSNIGFLVEFGAYMQNHHKYITMKNVTEACNRSYWRHYNGSRMWCIQVVDDSSYDWWLRMIVNNVNGRNRSAKMILSKNCTYYKCIISKVNFISSNSQVVSVLALNVLLCLLMVRPRLSCRLPCSQLEIKRWRSMHCR